jgi:EAL domain-containing protein (putative c-di-GMP-specific phosphodiesterase class I)/predicted transcriptional regulator
MGKYPVSRWARQMVQSLKPLLGKESQRSIVNQMLHSHPLARRLETAFYRNQVVTLFYFDIVKMRDIEERYGEEPGEMLIRALADSIHLCMHAVVQEQSILAIENFWADDYIVCIESPEPNDLHAYQIATMLRRDIAEQLYQATKDWIPEKVELHVGYSILYPDRGNLEKQLYLGIKQAMRIAKKGDDLRTSILYGEFQSILQNRSVRSLYQPIVDLQRGQILGWEALSRGPKGSYFERPDVLFSCAEEFGELFELEKLCRESAIAHVGQFSRDQKLFLNMNPKMVDDSRFVTGWTKQLLAKFDIKPDQIVFEITERHSIRDFAGFRKALNHYRDQGYLIAVDDVGSGYSNLQSIVELKPDFVKMDMSLIRNIDRDPTRQAVLEAFVTIATKVGCRLLAEGIETEEELRMVQRLGVQLGQGYLLGRPEAERVVVIPQRVLHVINRGVFDHSNSGKRIGAVTLGELCSRTYTVTKHTEVKHVHEMFHHQRDVTSIVVVEDGRPVGLVTRQHLFHVLGSRYGVPLYFNKTVLEVMDTSPLVLDRQMPIEQAAVYATERSRSKMYDDVIVVDGESYYGVVTVNHLLQSMSRI